MSGNGLEQSLPKGSCLCGAVAFAAEPPAGEPQVILRVALLDADPGVRPVERIFRRHEVPWCDPATSGIVSHPELPT